MEPMTIDQVRQELKLLELRIERDLRALQEKTGLSPIRVDLHTERDHVIGERGRPIIVGVQVCVEI